MTAAFRPFSPRLQLAALLLCSAGPLGAQTEDRGVLLIRQHGREVGQETFTWHWGPPGTPDSVSTAARYPRLRPAVELRATLRRSGPREATFQLERQEAGRAVFYYAVLNRNRVTVRRIERGGERAAEYPAHGTVVLLADSLLAPYAQLASPALQEERDLQAVFPATGERVTVSIECIRTGESGAAGGRICRLNGGLAGEIETGSDGRLLRVSLLIKGLEGLRMPD